MNKYLALLALATVAVCAASANPITGEDDVVSELALSPSNDEEIADLEGKTTGFSDFCISYRDYVVGDIRTSSNNMAANLFKMFFNAAEEIELDAIKTEQEAAERLGNQIHHPESKIANYNEDDSVDGVIGEGQKKIQESSNQGRNLLQGFMSAFAATRNAVTSNVMARLNTLKTTLSAATLTDSLKEACERIRTYDQELFSRFATAKSELAAHDASYQSVMLENVGCVTVRRIIRLDGICNLAMAVRDPLMKVITYKQ